MPPALSSAADADLERRVLRTVGWRLIPFLCLLYILNLLDRGNAGFARLSMQSDLGMSPAAFDISIGLFYFGYLLFEVPSNLLLRRVGARRWIARIMITWGLVSCATMAVTGPWGFALVRILLGVAEAGFFPGIVLFLTFWVPARHRARMMALFMTANAVASVIGNPLSGTIMHYLDGTAGLKNWQWLFLLEGLPSIAVGFVVFFYLTDRPEQARWLDQPARDWLVERLALEDHERRQRHGADLLRALVDRRVWLLIAVYATVAVGSNASSAYLPTLLQERFTGFNKLQIGLLAAGPNLCAAVVMTLWGMNSDRTGERRKHVASAALLAASGWAVSAAATEPWLAFAGFCLAQAGMMSMLPTFWALPTAFLSGAAAAGGIALINSVANLGGLIGPTVLGQLGLWALAATLALGAFLALLARD